MTTPLTTAVPTSTTDVTTFADLGIPADFARELDRQGITAPFPIQAATLPAALTGRDICGRAPTGSGKTLAFSIPTLALVGTAQARRPRALVLTPTRELAAQVRDTMLPLAGLRDHRVATVYGGTNIKHDIRALDRGVDVLVATPGRLEDLIERGSCDLRDVEIAVIDEADRMADMGFLPVVRRLLDQTADDRQTLLFSATLDGDVDVLVRRYQHDPSRHAVEETAEESGDVSHHFWSVTRQSRRPQAIEILRATSQAIVFVRTKRGADRLARQLDKAGVTTAAIHGNRNQNQRERALARFADGRVQALVATDVAARGIHVDDVAIVLHYDLPGSDKDYVHRSGRTGRAGADGTVVTLVLDEQEGDARKIQRALDLPSGTTRMDLEVLGRGSTRRAARNDQAPTPAASRKRPDDRRDTPNTGRRRPGGGARSRGRRSRAGRR